LVYPTTLVVAQNCSVSNGTSYMQWGNSGPFIYEYMKIQFLPRNKHTTIHHQGQMLNFSSK